MSTTDPKAEAVTEAAVRCAHLFSELMEFAELDFENGGCKLILETDEMAATKEALHAWRDAGEVFLSSLATRQPEGV